MINGLDKKVERALNDILDIVRKLPEGSRLTAVIGVAAVLIDMAHPGCQNCNAAGLMAFTNALSDVLGLEESHFPGLDQAEELDVPDIAYLEPAGNA